MPLYDMKCDSCGRTWIDQFFSMSTSVFPCPECRGAMHKLPSRPHTDLQQYHKPIVMHSVGCNSVEEIREIQRKCPDVAISTDPNDELYGVPVAANRKQKMDILRAVGYVEIT
jgi:putative FmdB family regulatory protein